MALPQGINFRATSGYVTDGANEDYDLGGSGASYPRTTAQGNTVGWVGTLFLTERDRNAGNDRRLAGTVYPNSGVDMDFRIDITAGNYNVRVAMGDANYAVAAGVELFDNASSLGTLSTGSTSGANQFKDATNTQYSAANWPGSNSAAAKTFASTICIFRVNGTAADRIAHLYIESAGGGTTRGTSFGHRGTAFNGGRAFIAIH